MPLSTATVTFDISDMLGVDYDRRRGIRGWVDTNIPTDTVVDTDGNKIRIGSGKLVVNEDGTGSATVWVPGAGSNPASWQTYFHFEYVDSGDHKKGRTTRTFGPFTITANANLADLIEEQEVPPDFAGQFRAEMEALRDEVAGSAATSNEQTVVIMGDSIVSQNASQYNTSGATIRTYNANGWFTQAQAMLGHRFKLLRNSGMSGQTSVQMLSRFATDVIAVAPGWCIFGGPTNDATAIGNGTMTLATAKANYLSMWDQCDTAGIRVVQCTITPRNAENGAAHKDALFALNQWLRDQGRSRPKFTLIDWYAPLSSGTNVDWKADYISSGDTSGLHPNARGAYNMGRLFADRIESMSSPVDVMPQSAAETANLVGTAALAQGTTGVIGTGGTGTAATGWQIQPLPTASFACTKVARTDGLPGEWQQVTVNSGAVKIGVNVTGFGTTYTTDDQVYAIAEFQHDDTSVPAFVGDYVRLNLIAMKPDFTPGRQSIAFEVPSVATFPPSSHFPSAGVMVTPLVLVPSTATLRLALQFEVKAGGGMRRVRVGRIGIYKVGTGPGADVWARSDAAIS